MGNCIQTQKTIVINKVTTTSAKPISSSASFPKEKENSLINSISQKNWMNVIDFLKFNELKEMGKVNRYVI